MSHQSGNLSMEKDGSDLENPSFVGLGLIGVKMWIRDFQRETIDWKPQTDKFLLAICLSGEMSNHLICLEKCMFFTAVLNRVLVIPSSKVDYQYNRVLYIDHINQCLGRKVVMRFEESSDIKKNHLRIDWFICYFSLRSNVLWMRIMLRSWRGWESQWGSLSPLGSRMWRSLIRGQFRRCSSKVLI